MACTFILDECLDQFIVSHQDHRRKDPLLVEAEQQAQEVRESWDPVRQKLRELDELKQAQELGEVTITYALERWLASVKADSDSGNEHTHSKYQTAAKHIGVWARSNHLLRLSQITPDALDHWKSLWSPKAKNPNDRIGKTMQPLRWPSRGRR